MDIAISSAGPDLEDLVRRVEAGEAVVLTRNGLAVARLEPVAPKSTWKDMSPGARRAAIDAVIAAQPKLPDDGISAARSQDFLYDEFGLPK